jgi:uncharacterized protein (DUF488 family)
MATIFTLGYQQRSIDEFIDILRARQISVLVDVRETAWSHKPGFSKTAFSQALATAGIEYVHARFAGNPKSLRRTAQTHDACLARYAEYIDGSDHIIDAFDQLIRELVAAGKRVCLTCFERHADDCHRSIIADRWKRRGRRTVQHLAVDGCARMVR